MKVFHWRSRNNKSLFHFAHLTKHFVQTLGFQCKRKMTEHIYINKQLFGRTAGHSVPQNMSIVKMH